MMTSKVAENYTKMADTDARDACGRLAEIAAALQLDHSRWIWLLAALSIMALLLGLGDGVSELLRYDRGAIAAGGCGGCSRPTSCIWTHTTCC